jgi:nucleotide-binding universal stress UspA family protein
MTGKLRHIVCAVRGRPESRATVTRAIDLAVESGAKLTFFHAINVEFLEHATVGPPRLLYQELREMATFMMMILVDRAQRRGVAEVDFVLREGDLRQQMLQFVGETDAEIMVVGRPVPGPGSDAFAPAELEAFITQLEQVGNLRVIRVSSPPVNNDGAL